jgi:hypothetical protein
MTTAWQTAISACTHAHRSVPLVHDLLTNIADRIVVCTGSKACNGDIVDRAALRALTANSCKTEYCAISLLVADFHLWLEIERGALSYRFLELTILSRC